MNDITTIERPSAGGTANPKWQEFQTIFNTITEGAANRDHEREHPHAALALLRQARFGAWRLPWAEGGGGASLRDVIEAALWLGAADSNVAHIYRNHFTVVERLLVGSKDARRNYLREAVQRGSIIGLASTELDRAQTGGASPFKTKLSVDGEGFRLNGTKFYSTGTLYADFIFVRATTDDDRGVSLVVPVDREGVERVDDWDGIGQRLTGTGTTNFHHARIEAAEIILDSDNPSFLLPFTSTIAQLFVTAINAGIIQASLRDAKTLLLSRSRNFYFAPADVAAADPLLQQAIGRIASDAFTAETVVLAAAERLDRVAAAREAGQSPDDLAHDASVAAAKAKVIVDELALRATGALFDVGGASAATRGKNLDRHWRNARTLASHNPASYKAQWLGAYELHGTKLPALGFF